MKDTVKRLEKTVEYLRNITEGTPEIAIILGSGLGRLADFIEGRQEISYEEIPNFPATTVPGHEGKLIFGRLGGRYVVAMKGRFHYYEGHDMGGCGISHTGIRDDGHKKPYGDQCCRGSEHRL